MLGFNYAKSYVLKMKKVTTSISGIRSIKGLFRVIDLDLGRFVNSNIHHEEQRETFQTAVDRFNITEPDLIKKRGMFLTLSKFYLLFFILSLALGFYFSSVKSIVSGLGLSLIPLSLWLRWSMRAWQIKIRRLSGLKTFIAYEGWWYECFTSADATILKKV